MDPKLNQTQPTPIEPAPPKPNPASNTLIVLLVVLTFVLLASTGFLAFQNYQLKMQAKNSIGYGVPSPISSASPDSKANWKTYTSNNYSFKYPTDWSLRDESGTVYLLNSNKTVSITISKEQYPYDGSSQVKYVTNPVTVSIDGQTIKTTEMISSDKGAFVDFEVEGYHILYGTDYPAVGTNASLNDYNAAKSTIIDIFSSFKFTSTTPTSPSPSPANTVTINYLLRPNWQTYTDNVAKFSLQYDTNPSGEFKTHLALGNAQPNKIVNINSCNTPNSGTYAGKEVCSSGYTVEIFNTYDGGSRKEWFAKTFTGYGPSCQVYYEDVSIAGKNGVLATSNCSSWGETYVLIPNGTQMIVYEFKEYSRDNKTGKITLSQFVKDAVTTFKFTN